MIKTFKNFILYKAIPVDDDIISAFSRLEITEKGVKGSRLVEEFCENEEEIDPKDVVKKIIRKVKESMKVYGIDINKLDSIKEVSSIQKRGPSAEIDVVIPLDVIYVLSTRIFPTANIARAIRTIASIFVLQLEYKFYVKEMNDLRGCLSSRDAQLRSLVSNCPSCQRHIYGFFLWDDEMGMPYFKLGQTVRGGDRSTSIDRDFKYVSAKIYLYKIWTPKHILSIENIIHNIPLLVPFKVSFDKGSGKTEFYKLWDQKMPLETMLHVVSQRIHEEDNTGNNKRKRGGTKQRIFSILFDRMAEDITEDEKTFLKKVKNDLLELEH